MTTINMIIYLSGLPISYLLFKKWSLRMDGSNKWTKGDRRFAFGAALCSWLGALTSIVALLITCDYFDDDKPVKW